ncbi:Serine/threonine-protein phosphatase 2A regulatory subunit B'' subunit gamma [Operophtera brumata]|uniref:Serine/threonine-protein phosphatase 2A regulatory subunit B'' subunit gamma n=1 Tax=Operophtera brumata TaxID=104452 RepID=A0A0L7L189_OPEBR|nr:Serine/threonine-protein phosphatase 2A regulatory subunit B'' subunit gamma [Operophtera brumata]
MSEKVKEEPNSDTVSNNSPPAAKPPDSKTIKKNNDLKNRLRKYIKKLDETGTSITKEESDKIEADTFKQLYRPRVETDIESYKKIPKFYYKLPRSDEVLAQKLREETRAQFLQKKSKELLDNAELKHLWSLLEKSNGSFTTANNDELSIDYFQLYLTASVFGRLQAVEGGIGRVRAVSLFNYVMRRVWLQQTRIGLSLYDVTAELVPSLAALDGLDSSFSSFYVCTAARKFLFFLDPLRIGRVRIRDVLSCSFLDDLLENWFSAASALRVYGQYGSGTLTRAFLQRVFQQCLTYDGEMDYKTYLDLVLALENRKQPAALAYLFRVLDINSTGYLDAYGSGTLTRAFLQRVFQQCLTYDGEMDYKTYLDLVLALENRKQPAALAYLFRVLDINSTGYLDAFTLNYFFKMILHGAEPVNFEDVKDEIFDMIRPKDPARITLHDLIRSGHGHTAVSILLELHGFWAYENREALAAAADHA